MFTFDFTQEKLARLLPKNTELSAWYQALSQVLPAFSINSPLRVAAFIAQCSHESREFTVLQENLNYDAAGLMRIFPRYFQGINPADYARRPEKIASRVYGSRMGNGAEASGDGWRFRGRGPIQLTGRDNYTACSRDLFGDLRLIENPDLVSSDKKTSLMTAAWFWKRNNINALADAGDIVAMTRRINGGTIGLEDRKKHYVHALAVLSGNTATKSTLVITETLRRGSQGDAVIRLQRALGITADGNFGPGTEAALRAWQTARGLTADGVAGARTLSVLLG
jgi:putative chitinase